MGEEGGGKGSRPGGLALVRILNVKYSYTHRGLSWLLESTRDCSSLVSSPEKATVIIIIVLLSSRL